MQVLNGLLNVLLGIVSAVLGVLLGVVAGVVWLLGIVLCATVLLLPLGLPVVRLGSRLFGLAGQLFHLP